MIQSSHQQQTCKQDKNKLTTQHTMALIKQPHKLSKLNPWASHAIKCEVLLCSLLAHVIHRVCAHQNHTRCWNDINLQIWRSISRAKWSMIRDELHRHDGRLFEFARWVLEKKWKHVTKYVGICENIGFPVFSNIFKYFQIFSNIFKYFLKLSIRPFHTSCDPMITRPFKEPYEAL